jgi:hypothetical protein
MTESPSSHARDADGLEATMSNFPKHFGPDVEVEEVDLDTADVRYRGKRLTDAEAKRVADDVLSRTPGRPSLSGAKETSPSLTVRLPKQDRARLEQVAAKRGRRPSEVVREALDDYLSRHAG